MQEELVLPESLASDVLQEPCDSVQEPVLDVALPDEGVPQELVAVDEVCIRRPSPSDAKKTKSMKVLLRPPAQSCGKRKRRKSS